MAQLEHEGGYGLLKGVFGITICILQAFAMFVLFLVAACGSNTTTNPSGPPPDQESPEASAVIGTSGGQVVVDDTTSSLYGAVVDIPAGALEQEIEVALYTLTKSDLEQSVGAIPSHFRYVGGIKIKPHDTVLHAPIHIYLPNAYGVADTDQLFAGRVTSLDDDQSYSIVYEVQAHAGSPVSFSADFFGSHCVLSPDQVLGLVGGAYVNNVNMPVPGGYITTPHSFPIISITDPEGAFRIPGGPAGTRTAVIAAPPADGVTVPTPPMGGVGIGAAEIPEVIEDDDITVDEITIVSDRIAESFLSDPPEPCVCDMENPTLWFIDSKGQNEPYTLSIGQSAQLYLIGESGFYGGSIPPDASLFGDITDFFTGLVTGTYTLGYSVMFSVRDPDVAVMDPASGLITAVSVGETQISGSAMVFRIALCSDGSSLPCIYSKYALGRVVVTEGESPTAEWVMRMKEFTTTSSITTCIRITAEGPCDCSYGTATQYYPSIQMGKIVVYQSGSNIYGYEVGEHGTRYVLRGTVEGDDVQCTYIVDAIDGDYYYYEEWTFSGTRSGNVVTGAGNLSATYMLAGPLCNLGYSELKICSGTGNFRIDITPYDASSAYDQSSDVSRPWLNADGCIK